MMHRRYDIVATLGPRSDNEAVWSGLLSAGATAFRLNTSHLSPSRIEGLLDRLQTFLHTSGARTPVVLDLQGSKWRLGECAELTLEPGRQIELICDSASNDAGMLPVPHKDFFQAALTSDGTIALNDARIILAIEKAGASSIRARVVTGGEISPRKGVTCPSTTFRSESLGEKDREILEMTQGMDGVRHAVSYVKDATEMSRYRTLMGATSYVIAKLERKTALEEAQEIAGFSEELWLCRGDLGAEMGLPAMAEAVHHFSGTVRSIPRPVLMAGQVLEHMTHYPDPTRSEACFLYDTLDRGYRGIVLSDETAIGRYPVESCRASAMFREDAL